MPIVTHRGKTYIRVRPALDPPAVAALRRELKVAREARRARFVMYMEQAGHTMTSLAQATGIDRSYISRIISGTRTPALDTTIRLSRALRVGLEEVARTLMPDAIFDLAPGPARTHHKEVSTK